MQKNANIRTELKKSIPSLVHIVLAVEELPFLVFVFVTDMKMLTLESGSVICYCKSLLVLYLLSFHIYNSRISNSINKYFYLQVTITQLEWFQQKWKYNSACNQQQTCQAYFDMP